MGTLSVDFVLLISHLKKLLLSVLKAKINTFSAASPTSDEIATDKSRQVVQVRLVLSLVLSPSEEL